MSSQKRLRADHEDVPLEERHRLSPALLPRTPLPPAAHTGADCRARAAATTTAAAAAAEG